MIVTKFKKNFKTCDKRPEKIEYFAECRRESAKSKRGTAPIDITGKLVDKVLCEQIVSAVVLEINRTKEIENEKDNITDIHAAALRRLR